MSWKPGLPLLDLLKHRKECGSFAGDPVEYHAMILNQISRQKLDAAKRSDPCRPDH